MAADKRLQILLESLYGDKGTTAAQKALGDTAKAGDKAAAGLDKVNKSGVSMGRALATLATGGALLKIGQALIGFAKNSIDVASNVEEAASKFSFVFGPAAEETGAALDEFAGAVGRSRYELREFAANFGGILEGMLGSKEAAGEMSVELAKLTTDLASFYNVSEGDAAAAITSGLVGETEPMRRFGVLLSAAAIEAEVFRMGLATSKKEITETMKVQARFNLIMQSTATAQGDAARTSDSYANQQRAMQAAVQDLSVAIGTILLPTVTDITGALTEMARRLQIVFDVQKSGSGVIDGIVDSNIAQAEGVDDLVEQYKRIEAQSKKWGGAAALLSGTQDDLNRNMEKVKTAVLEASSNSDEYTAALVEMGIASEWQVKHHKAAYEAAYNEGKAVQALREETEALARAAEQADSIMTGYGWTHQEVTGTVYDSNAAYDEFIGRLNASIERGAEAAANQEALAAAQAAYTAEFSSAMDTIAAASGIVSEGYGAAALAAEDSQARQTAANAAVSESYRQLASDIVQARLAEVMGEGGLEAATAMIQFQEALGLITPEEAGKLQEIAEKTQLITDTTNLMLDEYLTDGVLAQDEIEKLAAAIDLAEQSTTNSEIAIKTLADNGITNLEQLAISADNTRANFEDAKTEVENVGERVDGLPTEKTIDIYIVTHGSVPDVGGGVGGASGGGSLPPPGSYGGPGNGPQSGPMGATGYAVAGGGINISFAGAIFQGTSQQMASQIAQTVADKIGRLA